MSQKKKWDVTFVRYVGVIVEADTEEEAREIAERMKEPNEKVGVIKEEEEEEEQEDMEREDYDGFLNIQRAIKTGGSYHVD